MGTVCPVGCGGRCAPAGAAVGPGRVSPAPSVGGVGIEGSSPVPAVGTCRRWATRRVPVRPIPAAVEIPSFRRSAYLWRPVERMWSMRVLALGGSSRSFMVARTTAIPARSLRGVRSRARRCRGSPGTGGRRRRRALRLLWRVIPCGGGRTGGCRSRSPAREHVRAATRDGLSRRLASVAEVPQASRYAERFRVAAALADTGVAIKRQSLRRRHPNATEREVDVLLRAWLRRRPPDSPGRSRRSA